LSPAGLRGVWGILRHKADWHGKGSIRTKARSRADRFECAGDVAVCSRRIRFGAAPVKVCLERVKKGRAQAIVVNSGNANACTGIQGMKDALEMASFTERAERSGGLGDGRLDGRIGLTLPMNNVRAGL